MKRFGATLCGLLAICTCGLGAAEPPTPDAEAGQPATVTEDDLPLAGMHPTVREARKLAALGHVAQAMDLLETYLVAFPDDLETKVLYLRLKIDEQKKDIAATVTERVEGKEFILPYPHYDEAKLRSPVHISRQLDIVEHLIHGEQYQKAVEVLERIIVQQPKNEAALVLLDRTLAYLVRQEKRTLEREKAVRRGEELNDVLQRSIMPRKPKPIPRTVLVYPEDLDAEERERIRQQLRLKIKLMRFDQQPVGDVLRRVFAVAGLNFIILDSALSEETVSLDLIDESVEHVLEIIQRMVPLQFNYQGGSVYVTNQDNPILTTEIIRLRYGLSNVLAPPEIPDLGGGGGGGAGEGGGGAGLGALVGGGEGGEGGDTDIERFLEEALGSEGLVDWPEGSKYYLDKKMNTLVVRSSPATVAEIKRLLQFIDRPALQVLIEAKFVEIRADAMKDVGVDWAIIGRKEQNSAGTDNIYFGGGVGNSPNPFAAATDPTFPATYSQGIANAGNGLLAGIVGAGEGMFPNFSAQLRLMQERGQANVLTEPKILALNNSTGIIDIRTDVSYVADFENRTTGTNNRLTDTTGDNVVTTSTPVLVPRYETDELGIQLRVNPSIALNSDMVTLTVTPTVRDLVRIRTGANSSNDTVSDQTSVLRSTEQPEFSTRRLFTSLNVKDGETVVLGGLISELENKDNAGIPGLQDIPGLGRLFRRDTDSLQRSKLMVFLTVHIIDPTGAEYTDEVRTLTDSVRVALPSDVKEEARARWAAEAEAAARRAAEREAKVSVPAPREASPVNKRGGRR